MKAYVYRQEIAKDQFKYLSVVANELPSFYYLGFQLFSIEKQEARLSKLTFEYIWIKTKIPFPTLLLDEMVEYARGVQDEEKYKKSFRIK